MDWNGGSFVLTQKSFTLIEILAVIVIMGAMLMLVLPNLGVRQASALRDQARTLAGRIELTRQLAIVSGKPHRLLIDLEAGTSSVERFDRGTALDEENAAPDIASDYDLLPPTAEIPSYTPVNSALTESETLGENFFFEGIQTADGWIDDEQFGIAIDFVPNFSPDGRAAIAVGGPVGQLGDLELVAHRRCNSAQLALVFQETDVLPEVAKAHDRFEAPDPILISVDETSHRNSDSDMEANSGPNPEGTWTSSRVRKTAPSLRPATRNPQPSSRISSSALNISNSSFP